MRMLEYYPEKRIINSFDRDDLAFQCMIGFRKFTAYLDPFLPMNIISCKAYNTIMVEELEGTGKNLVAIVKDVYVFVGSFTYITDFMVLEDIGEFIMRDMVEVLIVNDGEVSIDVPDKILIDADDDPVTSIIDFTYPNILDNIDDVSYFQEKAIHAPTNEVVDTINDYLLEKVLQCSEPRACVRSRGPDNVVEKY
ncbi:homeodomain-like protein [Tanacetum coccineum]